MINKKTIVARSRLIINRVSGRMRKKMLDPFFFADLPAISIILLVSVNSDS